MSISTGKKHNQICYFFLLHYFNRIFRARREDETGRLRTQARGSTAFTQDAQALGLEDLLQRREVDDQQLAHDGPEDGVAEHSVAAESDLQHRLGLLAKHRAVIRAPLRHTTAFKIMLFQIPIAVSLKQLYYVNTRKSFHFN